MNYQPQPADYEVKIIGDKTTVEISAKLSDNDVMRLRHSIEDFLASLNPDKSRLAEPIVE